MKKMIIVLLLLISIQIDVMSKDIMGKDIELDKVRDEIVNALESDNEDSIKNSKDIIEKLIKENYTPQRASYLGSLTSKMAAFSFFPWSKISYAKKGSKILDKAISKAPDDVDVRLNRFNSYFYFPSFLKKEHFVQEDARWLITNVNNEKIRKDAYDSVYKALALFFLKEKDNAKYMKYFEKLTKKEYIQSVKKYKAEME